VRDEPGSGSPGGLEGAAGSPGPAKAARALVLWLLVAGIQLAAVFALGPADAENSAESSSEPLYDYSLAAGSLVLYGILVGVTFWIASLYPDRAAALGLRRFPPRALWLVLGVVVVSLAVSAALEPVLHAGREQGLEPEQWRPEEAAPFLVNAVVIVTIVPFAEELFFRGLGVRVFAVLGPVVAALATAVIFGLAHGILVALPALGFFGLALAWLRLRTDSVWPGIAAHAAYNALGIAAFFVSSAS
jgi:membrane protease YdiL (CAAX protease family)